MALFKCGGIQWWNNYYLAEEFFKFGTTLNWFTLDQDIRFLLDLLSCLFFFIYMYRDSEQKVLWKELARNLDKNVHLIPIGDFNVVLANFKRMPTSFSSKDDKFYDFVWSSNLIDFPLWRRKFTRRNSLSCSRLDRFLLNGAWISLFPTWSQSALPRGISDHNPILLTLEL